MILSRYILKEFGNRLALAIATMVSLFLVIELFEKMGDFATNKASLSQIFLFFLYKIPMFVALVIPIAALLSTMLLIGAFSRNNEFIAMKAAGMPMIRIVAPLLGMGVVLSGFVFSLNEWVVPTTMSKSNYILNIELRHVVKPNIFGNEIWVRGEGNLFWNANYFVRETAELNGLRILRLGSDYNIDLRIDAERAKWDGTSWTLFNATMWDFTNPAKVETKEINDEALPWLNTPPRSFRITDRATEEMGIKDLGTYIDDMEKEGYDATRYRVELYNKFSSPFFSLVMVIVAIPFAVRRGRNTATAVGIGISIVIGFSFWVTMSLGVSLGKGGVLPPLFASWFGNLLYLSGGAYMLLTSRQ